ncbi:MAG: hypothetical protein ABEI31_00310 [Halodesulfurarchaeum sp.]
MRERLTRRSLPVDWIDPLTKLAGVVLVAAALEIGIGSAPGLGLALAGGFLGVCTVFITEETE